MGNLPQEDMDYARDDGYEGVATLFEETLYGGNGSVGLIPDAGKPGRLVHKPNKPLESQVKVAVANGMMALIAQVYLENKCSAAEAMMDFATMLHHVETNWTGPDDGKKPTNLRVIRGGR